MVVVGIDEVGRGSWAGPLVAAAVALDKPIPGLNDSKKLSKKRREELAVIIKEEALAIGIGWVWPQAIDNGGITSAVKQAMAEALQEVSCDYDQVVIDGHINYLAASGFDDEKITNLIKADSLVPAVSAASIIAKVARDQYMAEQAKAYPGYGFDRHVGYGTPEHIKALQLLGISSLHRVSFKSIRVFLTGITS